MISKITRGISLLSDEALLAFIEVPRLFSGRGVLRMSPAFANSFGKIELSYCIEMRARAIMSSPLLFFFK